MAQAMREAYGDALLKMADDEAVVVLDADLAKATSSAKFADAYPERFFDVGIAEQNMMGVAAGLAVSGFKPYASSFALFASGRAYEQIRNAVCYSGAAVKIVATHAGLSPNADGGSHESVEDIALMRVLPGMTVLSPCDYRQALDMITQMKDMEGPAYIRLSRHPVPPVLAEETHTAIGRADTLAEGGDICIAATGVMVARAMEAAKLLKEKGIRAAVLNVHTIKPFDSETVCRYARACGRIITAEEHSVIGGLGSAVCEAVSGLAGNSHCQVRRIGIQDRFGQSGDLEELMEAYGLTARHIAKEAEEMCGGPGGGETVIVPTLACADRLNLKEDLDLLSELGVKMLHLDVMDGHYVPNLCFDMDTIRQIGTAYPFSMDVHLMVSDPENYIGPLSRAGAAYVSFHLDATSYAVRLLKQIGALGMKGGIALNPSQPVLFLKEVLPYVSFVLVMGVEPGFSGQDFLPETVRKVEELDRLREEKGLAFEIEVDGGLDNEGIRACIGHGADILVSGAFGVFKREKGLKGDFLDCQTAVRLAEKGRRKE